LGAAHNSTLANSFATNNRGCGFKVALNCKNITLANNTASENDQNGFHVIECSNAAFSGNNANWNNQHGFHLENSTSLNLTRNVANDNFEEGFLLQTSRNLILLNNTAQNNVIGLFLEEASNNTLTGNSILNNTGYGIFLSFSPGNLVYLNFFIMNNQGGMSQGFDDSSGNAWTNSTHGNFWSDYNGEDTDGDGIGDTANYSVGLSIDFRPLVLESLIAFSSLQVTGPANVTIEAGSIDIYSILCFRRPTFSLQATLYTKMAEKSKPLLGRLAQPSSWM
jgi:parallel beta-helix repeat protein